MPNRLLESRSRGNYEPLDSLLPAIGVCVLILLTVLQPIGCAHRRPGPQGQPVAEVTPYEQAMAANAVLATTNAAVAKGVIGVEEQGLISVEDAERILAVQFNIAVFDRELTLILQQGPDVAKAKAADITRLVDQIEKSASGLVSTGSLGIKNTSKQAEIQGNVAAVASLARSLIAALKLAGVLQ